MHDIHDIHSDTQVTTAERLAISMIHHRVTKPLAWNYVDGLGLECIHRTGKVTGHPEWRNWVVKQFDGLVHQDGTVDAYNLEEYSLDMIAPGKALFAVYDDTHHEKYRKALDMFQLQLEQQPRTPSGGYWHKGRYPNQMWLDGLYMQGALKARYACKYLAPDKKLAVIDDLISQFTLIYEHTYDERTGLLFHAWDESRRMLWADKTTGRSPCIWGRALGWYCMALVDAIDCLSREGDFQSQCKILVNLATSLAYALARWQDISGLWWQVMDQGGREYNYLESSCSAMFTYFLLKLARIATLSQDDGFLCRRAGSKGYEGLLRDRVTEDSEGYLHLHSICRGAGLGQAADIFPYRDGTFMYYCTKEPIVQDNWQGVAPLMLAALETDWKEQLDGTGMGNTGDTGATVTDGGRTGTAGTQDCYGR